MTGMLRRFLQGTLPAVALLLLAAHFFRAGLVVLAAGSCALIVLLFVPRTWAARVVRGILVLGTVEWLRTAWVIAEHRMAMGQPFGRMLVILGTVAVITLAGALLVGGGARDTKEVSS